MVSLQPHLDGRVIAEVAISCQCEPACIANDVSCMVYS